MLGEVGSFCFRKLSMGDPQKVSQGTHYRRKTVHTHHLGSSFNIHSTAKNTRGFFPTLYSQGPELGNRPRRNQRQTLCKQNSQFAFFPVRLHDKKTKIDVAALWREES